MEVETFWICRDQDCPKCDWPETFFEIVNGQLVAICCYKCDWRQAVE